MIGGGSESTSIPHFSNVAFNLKSFRPIMNMIRLRLIMVAPADAPFKTLPEYVAHAKANPGKVNFATSGPAALNSAVLLLMNRTAGITTTAVPFRGDADIVVALLSGQVHAAAVSADQAQAHVDAGRLRYLAVASQDRVPGLSAVPTFKELGYDVVVENMKGVVAPAGISDAIFSYLESRFRKASETDVYKAAVANSKFEAAIMDGPTFGRAMQRVSDDIAAAIPR
jgi:tripartite-type tricarboxylate transporter receptor subunit TctC